MHNKIAWAVPVFVLCSTPAQAQETITFTYDALGRLTATSVAGGTNSGVSSSYTYDAAGNRMAASTTLPTEGGTCTFAVPDQGFWYDWEFPNNQLGIFLQISGTCTAPTTFSYSFSPPGSPSGTFTAQPSSYGYYELPTPCAWGGSGNITTTITKISGPGTIIDGTATIVYYNC